MSSDRSRKAAKVRKMKIALAVREAETGRKGKGSNSARRKAQTTDSNNKPR